MASGAPAATHQSTPSETPYASTEASTPSATRSPSRLIRRSTANESGTASTATLDTRAATVLSTPGTRWALVEMSVSRPEVVWTANLASRKSAMMPRTPATNRIRSDGRWARAASSGSSTAR